MLLFGYGAKVGLGNMRVKAENRMLTKKKKKYGYEKGIARSYCVINDKELTSWFSTEGDIVFSTNNFYGNKQGYINGIAWELVVVKYLREVKQLIVMLR